MPKDVLPSAAAIDDVVERVNLHAPFKRGTVRNSEVTLGGVVEKGVELFIGGTEIIGSRKQMEIVKVKRLVRFLQKVHRCFHKAETAPVAADSFF